MLKKVESFGQVVAQVKVSTQLSSSEQLKA